jgi:hypothetical protein
LKEESKGFSFFGLLPVLCFEKILKMRTFAAGLE